MPTIDTRAAHRHRMAAKKGTGTPARSHASTA
jgi:hypothetical protein